MPSRIIKLLLGLITVGFLIYIYHYNSGDVQVRFGSASVVESSMAAVLIISFCAGMLVTAALAFVLGALHAIKDWRERKKHQRAQSHFELIVSGREHLAAGNFAAARDAFQRVLSQDKKNVLARSLLAETAYDEGDLKGALHVLDEARLAEKSSERTNVELLFLGAAINAELGNYTSAYDNLSLVIKAQPRNVFALRRIVTYAEKLGRLSEALEYQRSYIRELSSKQRDRAQDHLAYLELVRAKRENQNEPKALREAINDVLTRHRDFAPAIAERARLEAEDGNIKASAKLWESAYRQSGDVQYLKSLADTWLAKEQPSQALTAIQHAISSAPLGEQLKLRGRLFYVSLLLHLEMATDAARELDKLAADDFAETGEQFQLLVLRAKLIAREGKAPEAVSLLLKGIETIQNPDSPLAFHTSSDQRVGWLERKHIGLEKRFEPPLGLPIP